MVNILAGADSTPAAHTQGQEEATAAFLPFIF